MANGDYLEEPYLVGKRAGERKMYWDYSDRSVVTKVTFW